MRGILLPAALILAGCAPATMQGVRDLGPDKAYSFTAPQGYQAVYRDILEQVRKCHQGGMITAQMVVQGDLYHDTKSGSISVALHGGFGVDTYQVIDIAAIDDSSTSVTAHYSVGSVERQGELLRKWALEDYRACS